MTTKDRWNKKLERYQSRKAYFQTRYLQETYNTILVYFCTTGCANS